MSTLAILFTEYISRKFFGIDEILGSLLAAGSSICGVSAVVAVATSIKANEEYIAYAAGSVVLFDGITVPISPTIGQILGLSAIQYGIWVGVSMFSTGPVVAAGFLHSDLAGQWATLTKITRNSMIGVVAVSYAIFYTRKQTTFANHRDLDAPIQQRLYTFLRNIWNESPKFIVLFLFMIILSSIGTFSRNQTHIIENIYGWLFFISFVGLGFEIDIRNMKKTGSQPIVVMLLSLLLLSLVSLITVSVLL